MAEKRYNDQGAVTPEAMDIYNKSRSFISGIVGDRTPEDRIKQRCVIATGDPGVADILSFKNDPVSAALAALEEGAAIYVDTKMVEAGVLKNGHNSPVIAAFGRGDDLSESEGITRTSAGFLELKDKLSGSIVVIGDSTSALSTLCDLIERGEADPAMVIGVPVGFTNAVESKERLRGIEVPSISTEGNRGGTSIAVAAINEIINIRRIDIKNFQNLRESVSNYKEEDCGKGINMELAYQALQKYFGHTSFFPLQEKIIKAILLKNDVFVLMPTGGGKSLCYQLPALLFDGVTIVVSPLIALMKDQVDGLKANGIAAAYINSSLSSGEIQQIKTELLENKIRILYAAPERIMQHHFLSFLQHLNISLIAVDEAHCISEWGHDFRPEYRQLKMLKEYFPKISLVALTATAIPEVQRDIITQLKLSHPKIYKASFNRENLFYQVKPKDNAYRQLLQYLNEHKGESGIIYCYSRKSADNLADKIQRDGYRILPYHSGLNSDLRTATQDKFFNDYIDIIAATIAFGMGIDKPNIRFVIHYDLPKDLETYYQETGRAGRDGNRSDCILFYSYGDKRKIEYFIEQKTDETEKRIAYGKLRDMVNFCESRTCRRKVLLNYFSEKYQETNCGNCDNCLEPKETIDGTFIAQKIISCTSQVKERFGMSYIADVLCGSKNQKIIRNQHDILKAYGTGKEHSKKQWQVFIRELIKLGYLKLEGEEYPVVKLSQNSYDILSGKERCLLTKPTEKIQTKQKYCDEFFDRDLFEKLRILRKELAVAEGMPPYIIFHDSSLKAMATQFPRSLSDFRKIGGVGESKLQKYGELFVKEIVDYCNKYEHTLSFPVKKQTCSDKSKTYLVKEILKVHPRAYEPWTKEDDEKLIAEYKSGATIEELMERFGRKRGGIESRLRKLGIFP